jgi:uncharacterized caspase-like protein
MRVWWAIILVLGLWAGAAHAEKRIALVIGNSAYRHVTPLTNPKNDAHDVAVKLKALKFEVIESLDADYRHLRSALQQFGRAAVGADIAMVYYAGHGIEVNKQNYLIPIDAKLKSDVDVEFETVDLDLLMRAVTPAKKLRVVVLDACRDNPFLQTMTRSLAATRSIGRGLAKVEPIGDTLVAYAAKAGSVAADGAGRNSPYAAALLKHLGEPGLEIGLLFRKVRDDVLARTSGQQEPFVYGSLGSEGFYFRKAPAAATSKPGAAPAPTASQETLFWQSVMSSKNPDEVEAYLERYPNGEFAGLAKARLRSLKAQAAKQRSVATQREKEMAEIRRRLAEQEKLRQQDAAKRRALEEKLEREKAERQRLASRSVPKGPETQLKLPAGFLTGEQIRQLFSGNTSRWEAKLSGRDARSTFWPDGRMSGEIIDFENTDEGRWSGTLRLGEAGRTNRKLLPRCPDVSAR